MNHMPVPFDLKKYEVEKFKRLLNGENVKEDELSKLYDEIIQLFNHCIVNINRCADVSERAARWEKANKIYDDFQMKCVSVDELNTIKNMLMNVLQGC